MKPEIKEKQLIYTTTKFAGKNIFCTDHFADGTKKKRKVEYKSIDQRMTET